MKAPGDRGRFGDWLTAQRLARYKTQALALAAYAKLAGLKISESEYAQWESGSRVPKPDNPKIHGLYRFYGSKPEDRPEPEPPKRAEMGELVAAINDLVREMRLARERDQDAAAAMVQAAEALLSARRPAGDGESKEPAVPLGSSQ